MTIKLLLADDHIIFREGLKARLEQEEDFSIIGETDNGATAVELSVALLPDIALLDISMPILNGIDAARRIVSRAHGTKAIMLSMHTDKEYVSEALKAGAMGFLSKSSSVAELVTAIHGVVAGQPYLSSTISRALIGLISSPEGEAPNAQHGLSPREVQVLQLLAEGNCTKEVASTLNLSSKTIETYRLNLMKKLKITSVANLVRFAIREGITKVS